MKDFFMPRCASIRDRGLSGQSYLPPAESPRFSLTSEHTLSSGDYVVHIDHGIGRFVGMEYKSEGGEIQEGLRLLYRDNDVVLVDIQALSKISKYDRGKPLRLSKLGNGDWQRKKDKPGKNSRT